jgi:hypothetical protein
LQFGARVQMIEKGEIRANVILGYGTENGGDSQSLNRKKSRSKSRLAGKKENISLLE